jgi:hypothetical protein
VLKYTHYTHSLSRRGILRDIIFPEQLKAKIKRNKNQKSIRVHSYI